MSDGISKCQCAICKRQGTLPRAYSKKEIKSEYIQTSYKPEVILLVCDPCKVLFDRGLDMNAEWE